MEQLLSILNSKPLPEQRALAVRCGTTVGYLRKVVSAGLRIGPEICAGLERETCGALRCESLRPDVAWRRVPDTSWPWHPDGRPLVDPAPDLGDPIKQEAEVSHG